MCFVKMYVQYVYARCECMRVPLYVYPASQANVQIVCMLVGKHPLTEKTSALTFDRMQNSVVQGLAARVIGGRADACSTAVGQSVPDTSK